jgi:hypothetical protein
MSCVAFDTLEDLWQLAGYLWVYGFIYAALNRWWSSKYYFFLTQNSFLPSAFIYLLLNVVVVIGSAYSTWRLWSCENWDWSPVRLLISLIFIIAFSAWNTILHVTKSFLATTVVMFVISLHVVAMIVFSFIGGTGYADTFAAIIWIAIFIYTAYLLFISFMLWRNRDKLVESEKAFLEKEKEIKERQEIAETQEIDQLSDPFNGNAPVKQNSVNTQYSSLSHASNTLLKRNFSKNQQQINQTNSNQINNNNIQNQDLI